MNALADLLIRHKAIEFGDFTLSSGAKSRYYVDVKTAVTHPEFLSAIAHEIAERYEFDVVAGVAVGGVPLAVATALAAKKPFAIIRSEEKDHGKKNLIIGEVKEKVVLLVEDVTTSGGSALYRLRFIGAKPRQPNPAFRSSNTCFKEQPDMAASRIWGMEAALHL